jgi:hypothetical protein
MIRMALFPLLLLVSLRSSDLMATDFPQAEVSNGVIQAKLYLPDPERGYYRGTRFDWSGVICSLKFKGHEYFGQWFEQYDPKIHDAIAGPVEEYLTNDAGLGYAEAKAGGTFVRIGVGVVRKPEEPAYQRFHTYEIVDPGKWSVKKGPDWIEFVHELKDESGYAYIYTKKVRLMKGKPELTLEHTLKNTGRRMIETLQYNHNFFVMDQQPTGPDFAIAFPFDVRAKEEMKGLAKVGGGRLEYLRQLEVGQSAFTALEGFGITAKDYDFRIENRKTGTGVRIRGDQPLVKLYFWSIRTTLCPEPYIKLKVEPGKTAKWKIGYEFYTLPSNPAR